MSETYQFKLPLMQPSQAQKHVTFNEVAALLDAVAQLRFVSIVTTTPPVSPADGAAYFVAPVATGSWFGQEGSVAVSANGGWMFVTPKVGWRAWVEETQTQLYFDGISWIDDIEASSPNGALIRNRIIEFDHNIIAGAIHFSSTDIPSNSMVYGVTGRVIEAVVADASATGWEVGINADNSRYGTGYGLPLNSFVHSVSSAPTTYYADTSLRVACVGGDFISGKIRFCLHLLELTPPVSV